MERLSLKYSGPTKSVLSPMIPKGRMSSKKEKQITHILQKTRQTTQNSRTIMDFSTPINNAP